MQTAKLIKNTTTIATKHTETEVDKNEEVGT